MAARRNPRPLNGRRSRLLEPGVHKTLVDACRQGAPVALAAACAGIGERSFADWMTRGREEEDRLTAPVPDGHPEPSPDPVEVPYHRLYREVLLARSQAGLRGVLNIQRSAAGGFVTEEKTEEMPDGTVIKTVKKAPPDWRAAAFLLERTHRASFGKDAMQVELVGSTATSGGGGGELGDDAALALAARLGANLEAARLALPSAEDIEDAIVVEDGA